ncbi:MAG: hypothetical protein HY858_15840 [Candidatus Solibacter usitatus]|nr:hypothetical protein [Candidatus Solibacter usitatus]
MRGLRERLLALLGFYAFRCNSCRLRFVIRPMGARASAFARCPRCFRMDLSTWDPKYYHGDLWMDLKVWLGWYRWRCDPCRRNFVSWRPRREKYVRPAGEAAPYSAPHSDYQELHDV